MSYVLFDYGSPEEREAMIWLRDQPPGEASCSCGALATQLIVTGGYGAAKYFTSFELFCGDTDHLRSPLNRWITTVEADGDRWPTPW